MQSLRSQTVRLISYFICDEALVPEFSVKLVLHAVVYEKNWLRQAQVGTPTSMDICSGFRLLNPSEHKIGKALLKAQKHDPQSPRIWRSLRRTLGATLAMAQTFRTACFKRIKWRSRSRVMTFLIKFHLEIHGVAQQTMTSFLSMLVRDPSRLAGRPRIDCAAGGEQGLEFLLDICSPNRPARGNHFAVPRPRCNMPSEELLADLHAKQIFAFPPESLCEELIKCYFCCFHPFFPVVNPATFLEQYTEHGTSRMSPLLLWSMFSLAASVHLLRSEHELH